MPTSSTAAQPAQPDQPAPSTGPQPDHDDDATSVDSDHGDQLRDGDALQATDDEELKESFDRSIEEGAERLNRTWPGLFATGLMAGIDVGFGVLALLFVEHETGSIILGGLAFTIGFLAVTLGRSELFTENFLVPVTTVITRKGTPRQLARLWTGTYVTNLLGGWIVAVLVVIAYPDLHEVITERGMEILDRALSMESFVLAILAGAAITLMTWMVRNAEGEGGRLIAVIGFGFLLSAGHLNHVVVISIKMFAALQVGDVPFGYLDWLSLSTFAMVGNMIGGLGLVTLLRLVQVGGSHIRRRRDDTLRLDDGEKHQHIQEAQNGEDSPQPRGASSPAW